MITGPSDRQGHRYRRYGVIGGVALAHAGLFALLGLAGALPAPPTMLAPIEVELFRPPAPVAPPVPDPEPTPQAGGGAPAAASRVNRPPDPPTVPPELPAPPQLAPEPTLTVGASATATLNSGLGQGGEGTGTGSGTDEGQGSGRGSGPMILRGASNGEIMEFVPPEARRRRVPGRVAVNCLIRTDTRLDDCRLVDETPGGFGFGEAGVRIAQTHFRFRPPLTGSGRPVEGARVTVFVEFGRQR